MAKNRRARTAPQQASTAQADHGNGAIGLLEGLPTSAVSATEAGLPATEQGHESAHRESKADGVTGAAPAVTSPEGEVSSPDRTLTQEVGVWGTARPVTETGGFLQLGTEDEGFQTVLDPEAALLAAHEAFSEAAAAYGSALQAKQVAGENAKAKAEAFELAYTRLQGAKFTVQVAKERAQAAAGQMTLDGVASP